MAIKINSGKVLRALISTLAAFTVLAAVFQIGLRWEQKQVKLNSIVYFSNGDAMTGYLSLTWSGDFVLSDAQENAKAEFTLYNVAAMRKIGAPPPPPFPWRLLSAIALSLFLSVTTFTLVWYGTKD